MAAHPLAGARGVGRMPVPHALTRLEPLLEAPFDHRGDEGVLVLEVPVDRAGRQAGSLAHQVDRLCPRSRARRRSRRRRRGCAGARPPRSPVASSARPPLDGTARTAFTVAITTETRRGHDQEPRLHRVPVAERRGVADVRPRGARCRAGSRRSRRRRAAPRRRRRPPDRDPPRGAERARLPRLGGRRRRRDRPRAAMPPASPWTTVRSSIPSASGTSSSPRWSRARRSLRAARCRAS